MIDRQIKCYCDHCPEFTCTTTNGLCYAEWKIELEKRYNCFNKDDPFIVKTIVCNETASSTSHVIRRCCNSGDFCNKDDKLLPSEDEARNLFNLYHPRPQTSLWRTFNEQYFNLPLSFKIFVTLAALMLLIYILALIQNTAAIRRKRRRAPLPTSGPNQPNTTSTGSSALKLFMSRIFGFRRLNVGAAGRQTRRAPLTSRVRDSNQQPEEQQHLAQTRSTDPPVLIKSATTSNTHNVPPSRRISGRQYEDSENSSFKANSEVYAVYDSNSMASREPLINNGNLHSRPNLLNNAQHPLNQQHPGPFMTDHIHRSEMQSTFQMTIGSAAVQYNKTDTSSGSGAGQPYLTQRSIAHDIELVEVVGRGYYGVVWRGEYKGEPVAVKIFSPMAERSWEREAEIYQTTMLRHKNILGFIATDKRHDANLTGYWLVTDFYPMGSLYDFLKENSMSMADAVRMAFSIANGLSHLHVEIFGTRGKPAIAHRDIKSKNILVKNDGMCCIADLGMAVRYNSGTGVVDAPTNTRAGTRRYLAPEILDNKLNLMDFDGVKATDIYAMGLVLWEILRRTCLIHPSATGHIDPNFSYSIEQQQTTAPTTPSNSGGLSPNTTRLRQVVCDNISSTAFSPAQQQQQLQSQHEAQQSAVQTQAQPLQQPTQQETPPQAVTQEDMSKPSEALTLGSETSANVGTVPGYQPFHTVAATLASAAGTPQQPATSTPQRSPKEHVLPAMKKVMDPASFQESMETTIDDLGHELAVICESYEVPYQNQVALDPSADEMRDAVCVRKLRPTMSYRWSKFASMRDYTNIMIECWYEKPQARLSALRVRKSISDIARKYFNMNMEYD